MDNIYKEELMDIYKNPAHRGKITNPSVSVNRENSMCGDTINLDLKIKNDVITDAKFSGSACAVSVISSDILLEELVGKTVDIVKKITKEDLLNLLDLNLTTSRVKCATLVLNALHDAIKHYEENSMDNKDRKDKKIKKVDNLADVLDMYPEVEEVLYDYGLHCVGCALNAFDTIEAGAKVHGIEDREIDEMVERMNEVVNTQE